MVDYKLIFYTGVPIFFLALIYFLSGWADLLETVIFIVVFPVLYIILTCSQETFFMHLFPVFFLVYLIFYLGWLVFLDAWFLLLLF